MVKNTDFRKKPGDCFASNNILPLFSVFNFKCKGVWCKTTLFLWISSYGELLFNTTSQQLKNSFSYTALSSQQEQTHEIMDLWVLFFGVLATGFGWTNIIFSLADVLDTDWENLKSSSGWGLQTWLCYCSLATNGLWEAQSCSLHPLDSWSE